MKRSSPLVAQTLLLAGMALALIALSSPATAASACLALGDYYTVTSQCGPERGIAGGMLPQLAMVAAMGGIAIAAVSLKRNVRRFKSVAIRLSRDP